jgi:hypothetical protein
MPFLGGEGVGCQKWAEQTKNAMLGPFLPSSSILSELMSEVEGMEKRKT